MTSIEQISAKGYAKVNLGLWITADNYNEIGEFAPSDGGQKHRIRTVFYALPDIYDEVYLDIARHDNHNGIQISDIIINNLNEGYHHSIQKEDNIIYKVFNIYQKYNVFDKKFDNLTITVTVDKRIPMAAGLAGGSADASAASKCFEALCNKEKLIENRAKIDSDLANLGADVAFARLAANNDGYAYAVGENYGEVLTDIIVGSKELSGFPRVSIIAQPFGISTKQSYLTFDELVASRFITVTDDSSIQSCIDVIKQSGITGRKKIKRSAFYNDLQAVAFKLKPELKESVNRLSTQNPENHYMVTGSGPTIIEISAR